MNAVLNQITTDISVPQLIQLIRSLLEDRSIYNYNKLRSNQTLADKLSQSASATSPNNDQGIAYLQLLEIFTFGYLSDYLTTLQHQHQHQHQHNLPQLSSLEEQKLAELSILRVLKKLVSKHTNKVLFADILKVLTVLSPASSNQNQNRNGNENENGAANTNTSYKNSQYIELEQHIKNLICNGLIEAKIDSYHWTLQVTNIAYHEDILIGTAVPGTTAANKSQLQSQTQPQLFFYSESNLEASSPRDPFRTFIKNPEYLINRLLKFKHENIAKAYKVFEIDGDLQQTGLAWAHRNSSGPNNNTDTFNGNEGNVRLGSATSDSNNTLDKTLDVVAAVGDDDAERVDCGHENEILEDDEEMLENPDTVNTKKRKQSG